MNRIGRSTFALAASLLLARAAPPRILSAHYEIRQVGTMDSLPNGDMSYDQYHAVLVTVAFDQPLFVNGSVTFSSLSPVDLDSKHYLYGLTRLSCGGKLVDSHPPLLPPSVADPTMTRGGAAQRMGVPTFLVPLNEHYPHKSHRLLSVFRTVDREGRPSLGANQYGAMLILDYEEGGEDAVLMDPALLKSCSLAFLPEEEQSWWPTGRITNVAGEAVVGAAPLTQADPEHDEEHARSLARAANAIHREAEAARSKAAAEQRRRHQDGGALTNDTASAGAGEGGEEGDEEDEGEEDEDRSAMSAEERNHLAVTVLLERVRGRHFADSSNSVDTVQVFSLLEVLHRVGSLERIEANQYFELIEDPLLNLLVPVAVNIAVQAMKSPIIMALCKLLEQLLPKLLAKPIAGEIQMLQRAAGVGRMPDLPEEVQRTLDRVEAEGLRDGAGTGDVALATARAAARKLLAATRSADRAGADAGAGVQAGSEAGGAAGAASSAASASASGSSVSASAAAAAATAALLDSMSAAADADAAAEAEAVTSARFTPGLAPSDGPLRPGSQPPRPGGEAATRFAEGMHFHEVGAELLSAAEAGSNPCHAETQDQCTGDPRRKCAWCVREDVDGRSYACVPCGQIDGRQAQGFACRPVQAVCENPESKPPAPGGAPVNDDPWGPAPSGTQLEEVIADNIVDRAVTSIFHTTHQSLAKSLREDVNQTVIRGASRALTQSLTVSLTQSLAITLTSALSKVITRISTKELTMALTPSLTHALVPAIAQSLMHKPAVDYYCHYCAKHKVYCENCHGAAVEEYYLAYYADYYAEYYSRYYAYWYGTIYSDLFVSEQLDAAAHSSRPSSGTAP